MEKNNYEKIFCNASLYSISPTEPAEQLGQSGISTSHGGCKLDRWLWDGVLGESEGTDGKVQLLEGLHWSDFVGH